MKGGKFVQAHSPGGTPISGEYNAQRLLDVKIRSIDICGILGIPNIVVHAGTVESADKKLFFEKNKEFFIKLIPTMERNNVNVLCENSTQKNMGNMYFTNSGKDMKEFVEHVNHPLFHACWDTGHGNCEGNQYDDILEIGNDLYAVHINDNSGRGDEHVIPYLGTLNMDEVMNALNDYEDTLEKIIELCNKNGSIPIICSPTPHDEYSDTPSDNWTANSGLFVCRDIAEKTARKHGLIFVDMHKSIMNYIESRPIGTDRIHPNEFGYHLMAETFMTSVGIKEEFEKDKKVLLSEVNKKRYEIERIIRCIMHVERDTMLWQFEPDKSLDERKRLVGERIEREKLNGFVATGELYLKNIDYIDELRGKLIKITTEMYQ